MKDEDYDAACDLASEMNYWDAAKYLRREMGISLIEAVYLTERIAESKPDTALGVSVSARRVS